MLDPSGRPNVVILCAADLGFDYAFIMTATNDRVPCAYIENRRVADLEPDDPIEVTYDPVRAFADVPTGRSHRGREELVVEGSQAKTVLRWQQWANIPAHDGPAVNLPTRTELGNAPLPQLYHLGQDRGQMLELASAHPEVADRMAARLESILASTSTRTADGRGDHR